MTGPSDTVRRIDPERWPSERPLFVAVLIVSFLFWLVIVVTIFGLIYAVIFGLVFFISRLVFVTYVRGSGIRLGPNQFPELHGRVVELSRAMGMDPPATYLMQAGGALNAFATRFLRTNMVVLYSDLLEACGDNTGARDMIIAHELGHLRCGHLRFLWLTFPGHFVPFLGTALSRAREYTCDRFGAAGAGSASDATLGLTILSAGPKYAPSVNLDAFVRQRDEIDTGFMTLGEWLSSHPPLAKRVAAIDRSLGPRGFRPARGPGRAVAILLGTMTAAGTLTALSVGLGRALLEDIDRLSRLPGEGGDELLVTHPRVATDFRRITRFIQREWDAAPPETLFDVKDRWAERGVGNFPHDPFDGLDYGYERDGVGFRLWSSGPDGIPGTSDDLYQEWTLP